MRQARFLLQRQALAAVAGAEPAATGRALSQLAPEAASHAPAAEAGPSSAAALAALRSRLQAGPELGDFIKGTDASAYSVYAPKPKASFRERGALPSPSTLSPGTLTRARPPARPPHPALPRRRRRASPIG
jgi:hypothetical protein